MHIQERVSLGLLLGGLLSVFPAPASAQTTATGVGRSNIPIQGHTGIIQEPINTAQMYDGVNRIARLIGMSGRRNTKVYRMDAVGNMEHGMPVVVHSVDPAGPNGVATAEGKVTSVDRVNGRIGVKYTDGSTETLRVAQHAVGTSGTPEVKGRRVVVYSSDKSGQQVVQYFKRKS
jgi:hypothetical protein